MTAHGYYVSKVELEGQEMATLDQRNREGSGYYSKKSGLCPIGNGEPLKTFTW